MTTKTVDSEANGASLSLLDNMPESAIYEYDINNRLKKITTADTIAAYSYLPDGRRASKTVNGVKTSHIWDGNNIVADTKNGILTKYIRSNKLEQAVTGDNIQNYTVDSRGDVIDFGDADYFYDAFGNVQIETNPNPFGYCGEYFDQETGFIYLRNRYYDPTIGRFITEDPARDQLNWYTYCDNNPIMFVDPSGLYKLEKGTNGTVYAVIESGDTLSGIAKSEVNNASAYRKMNYSGNPNSIWVGQKINITGIYNKNYPNPFIRYPNTSISTAYNDDNDSGYMLDKETTVVLTAILTPVVKWGVGGGLSFAGANYEKNVAKPFVKGQPIGSIQEGVDPNTLTSQSKDLSNLDSNRVKNAVKFAGDQSIEVTSDGIIRNGHHRVKYAIENGKMIDVRIVP